MPMRDRLTVAHQDLDCVQPKKNYKILIFSRHVNRDFAAKVWNRRCEF